MGLRYKEHCLNAASHMGMGWKSCQVGGGPEKDCYCTDWQWVFAQYTVGGAVSQPLLGAGYDGRVLVG